MKFYKLTLPFFLLFLLLFQKVEAGNDLTSHPADDILENIFNFNFSEAGKKLGDCYLHSRDKQFLQIELAWWQAIEEGNRQALRQFYDKMKIYNENYKTNEEYMNLIINTYILRYHMAIKNYPAAVFDYLKIKDLMGNKQKGKDSGKLPEHLFSLYKNLIELAEMSYNLNPFKNDELEQREKHIRQIKVHAGSSDFIRSTLGHYFLFKYFKDLANEPENANIHQSVLHDRFPGNPFFKPEANNYETILTKNIK